MKYVLSSIKYQYQHWYRYRLPTFGSISPSLARHFVSNIYRPTHLNMCFNPLMLYSHVGQLSGSWGLCLVWVFGSWQDTCKSVRTNLQNHSSSIETLYLKCNHWGQHMLISLNHLSEKVHTVHCEHWSDVNVPIINAFTMFSRGSWFQYGKKYLQRKWSLDVLLAGFNG